MNQNLIHAVQRKFHLFFYNFGLLFPLPILLLTLQGNGPVTLRAAYDRPYIWSTATLPIVAPTFDQCILLAKLFKTSMDYIAGLTDDPEPHTRSTKEIPPFLQD